MLGPTALKGKVNASRQRWRRLIADLAETIALLSVYGALKPAVGAGGRRFVVRLRRVAVRPRRLPFFVVVRAGGLVRRDARFP
jgi:ribosomal protein L39E